MKRPAGLLFLVMLLTLVGAANAADQKARLVLKAEKGQIARYRTTGTVNLEAGANKATMEIKEVEKLTYAPVSTPPNAIQFERISESSEVTINGMKISPPDDKDTDTVVLLPDGTLSSYKSTNEDKQEVATGVRVLMATNVLFPDKEVGVGDKWSRELKADAALGSQAGKAEFELLGFEKSAGVDSAKLKMTYAESGVTPAIHAAGTVWIELASGDTVVSDMQIDNIPFGEGGPVASGKLRRERTEGSPIAASATAASGAPPAAKAEPPKPKTIDDIVKDYEKQPGLFTLYRKKDNNNRETIYLELREDQLEKLFFLQATASTGTGENVIAGDPLRDVLFKFITLPEDRLVMVTPNIMFKADPNTPVARSVKRAFADGYLDSWKIEARQPDRKSLLINISDLFLKDLGQAGSTLGGGPFAAIFGGGGSYSLDREKTYLVTLKTMPENLFAQTAYHFAKGGGPSFGSPLADPKSAPLKVDFNLFQLKDEGYKPRLADPRVGFFYTEYQDFTRDDKDSQMVRYCYRWNVEKADPKAVVSAPKQPIVFWLDNAIPTEYRPAVREGIEMWNKAFLRIGIKDAIVVKQMPDDADWDHADMRYNVIRWSTTQSPPYGAIALFRVNPLTGQILNASITVDAILARSNKLEKRRLIDPSTWFVDAPKQGPTARHPWRCELAEGALDQAWFGDVALSMLEPQGINRAAYTHGFLRSIVAHEMGHILGLFHNFAASTQNDLTELANGKRLSERGVVASVMDYFPFNIAALKRQGVDYWTSTVGPYDMWAVDYGYRNLPGKTPEEDEPALRAVAARCNEPGHAFQNDMQADGWDPYVARFDLSKEPLDYWTRDLQVTRYLLFNLQPRLPRKGQSYWEFTRTFNGLLNHYARAAAVSSRYLGALRLNANYAGDPGEKPTLSPVDAAKQRRALKMLNDCIFAENAFNFPASYYTHFADDPFPSMETFLFSSGMSGDFPVRDQLSDMQRAALRRIFGTATMSRILNNEFKVGPAAHPLTLAEVFETVSTSVWTELSAGKSITPLRRQLQRAYLDLMIDTALAQGAGTPADAKMLAWDRLRWLKGRIAASPKSAARDTYTRVHLAEAQMRINRALNASQTLSGAAPAAGISLRQLLGGGEQK
jgi:hypothetical protein